MLAEVEEQTLLALCHVQVGDALERGQCFGTLQWLPRSALYCPVLDLVLLKKLLSTLATGSARSVVPPFDFSRHRLSSVALGWKLNLQ